MSNLIETSCQTYKGHVIQQFEDWEGIEEYTYVDGRIPANNINDAKRVINGIYYNF